LKNIGDYVYQNLKATFNDIVRDDKVSEKLKKLVTENVNYQFKAKIDALGNEIKVETEKLKS